MFEDTYLTISYPSEGIYREKGSKFIALAFPVVSENEVKNHIVEIKKQYYDARHHCYAYILGANKEAYRMNDDGEPSGTAGRPIYGQLLSKNVTNILIVVIRYFGGIKLGVSGLINAYKTAAKDALEANTIVEKFIEEYYSISFDPIVMNKVMTLLKKDCVKIFEQKYENQSIINFSVQKKEADSLIDHLTKINQLKITTWIR
ncbi:MAG TPA: YigZ family protein [Bacteroidales bacterium]|nr:YigZ family protein [Bacteroidales bacterium]